MYLVKTRFYFICENIGALNIKIILIITLVFFGSKLTFGSCGFFSPSACKETMQRYFDRKNPNMNVFSARYLHVLHKTAWIESQYLLKIVHVKISDFYHPL